MVAGAGPDRRAPPLELPAARDQHGLQLVQVGEGAVGHRLVDESTDQFSTIDVISPVTVVGVRGSASAGAATAFLAELVARLSLPVRATQVDGGTRREIWECYDGDLDPPSVQVTRHEWEKRDNRLRPHQTLGYLTSLQFLGSLNSHMSRTRRAV